MGYLFDEMKNEIKTGDVVSWETTKITSLVGFIIYLYQKITGVIYPNIGVVIKLGGRLFVISGDYPKVVLTPLDSLDSFLWYDTKTQGVLNHKVNWLLSVVGNPCSFKDSLKARAATRLVTKFLHDFNYLNSGLITRYELIQQLKQNVDFCTPLNVIRKRPEGVDYEF